VTAERAGAEALAARSPGAAAEGAVVPAAQKPRLPLVGGNAGMSRAQLVRWCLSSRNALLHPC
jgi:hypothetical protein